MQNKNVVELMLWI